MALDFAVIHQWIVDELARRRPVAESMPRLIDQCEKALPHEDWAVLRSIPYADISSLLEWIQKTFLEEPPSLPLRGLWFGLFNPCPDGRTPVAELYVCGSERFHADPDDDNWAIGPTWWPDGRYANSAVLADIYRIAYRQDNGAAQDKAALRIDAEYPLCLGYAAFAIHETIEMAEPSLLLGKSPSLGVAVGFDSGDFVLIGKLTDHGLVPFAAEDKEPETTLASVIQSLRSPNVHEALAAVLELRRTGNHVQEVLPELVSLANSAQHGGLRQMVVYNLPAIAPTDPRSKAAVLQALKDSTPSVRREALQALIAFEELSEQDLGEIKRMENDPDEHVASWSEIALRNIRLRNERTKE